MRASVWVIAFLLCAPSAVRSQDAFPLATAQIVDAPDVSGWPQAATITGLHFTGYSTAIEFTKQWGNDRWPDVVPPGWTGPLQYTLWLFVKNGDQWVGSGFVQFWYGRNASGDPGQPDVPSRYHLNYYYAPRWRPMDGHGPIRPGEPIGFMVTSGNARDGVGPYGPMERSNVVVVPATDSGDFSFAPSQPPPVTPPVIPPPIVQPPPVVYVPPPAPPPPLPTGDLSIVVAQAAANQAALMAQIELLKVQVAAARQDVADFRAAVKSKWTAIVESPIFRYGMAALAGALAKWKL